jgi:hypothetical protein
VKAGRLKLVLKARHAVAKGRYTLTLRVKQGARAATVKLR